MPAGWAKRGYELGFGVGIATGYATLGRIGYEGRFDYAAIGNVTILASRLSSQAEANQILLSPRAHAVVEGRVEVESDRGAPAQGHEPAGGRGERGGRDRRVTDAAELQATAARLWAAPGAVPGAARAE